MSIKTSGLFLIVITLFSVAAAQAAALGDTFCESRLTQVAQADNSLSKLIRSNAVHFWSAMQTAPFPPALAQLVRHSGVVTGDPHLGNFALIPIDAKSGERSLQFVNVDFDDAGVGPFALDFLRFVVSAKAIEWDVQQKIAPLKKVVAAYIDGLNGRPAAMPDRLRLEQEKGVENYETELSELVENRLEGKRGKKSERLAVDGEEVVELKKSDKLKKSDFEDILKDAKILDVVRIKKSRGGSADQKRYWVLVEDKAGTKRIMEFKEWSETGLTAYQPQKPRKQWLKDLHPVFWPGALPDSYDLAEIGGTFYWVREKKKTLVDVPYEPKNTEEFALLSQMILYVAHELGAIHGRQQQSSGYREQLNNPETSEKFRQAVKEVYKEYLRFAKESLKRNQ